MILFGIPSRVQRFFRPVRRQLSRPIANALPAMTLALLLAPHRRCLKCGQRVILAAPPGLIGAGIRTRAVAPPPR
jgi:hypothetical protein